MKRTLIHGGGVLLDTGFEPRDVLIEGGIIVELGRDLSRVADCERVSAAGCLVLPGLIDFHVHIGDRIGEFALADSYHSGSQAAILSGVTTLIGFVTQANDRTLAECLDEARAKVTEESYCDAAFHLTPTRFADADWHDIKRLARAGQRTFKFYTTYREAGLYQGWNALRHIFERLTRYGARILVHAEDQETLDRIAATESVPDEAFSHTVLRPPEAEIAAIRKVIELARATGAAVHIVHVSTAEGAQMIFDARSSVHISCETAPQYLLLNENELRGENGHRFLCTPPLRSEENRIALEEQAVAGTFDIFATDHCAFTSADKDRCRAEFRRVPSGVAGVGAMFPLLYERLVIQKGMPIHELARRMSTNAARLAGLLPQKGTIRKGSDADLVILNMKGARRPVRSSTADCYETYETFETTLDFRYVFLRGEMVVKDNRLAQADHPTGQAIRATS
ncbi:MAG: amidohydrolase family protein [bacterium]|nr:amidohydrolase family protein [bacterium]